MTMTATNSMIMLTKKCVANTIVRRTVSVSSHFNRPASATPASAKKPITQDQSNNMQAWQVHSFGGVEQLSLSDSVRIPMLAGPNDVLVQISTTSVNPIDLAMLGMGIPFIYNIYEILCEHIHSI
jgi:hypothetical protein